MAGSLKLHELTGSPNNVKVRIALGYKKLPYERIPIALEAFPGNRDALIKISRQPRTPVLQHDNTVMYDSGAILRYLDANFPDSPTLFSTDYAAFGEIEQWELWARSQLSAPIGAMFGQVLSGAIDAAACSKASADLNALTGKVEDQLSQTKFLTGDKMTAADVVCVPGVNLGMLNKTAAAGHPMAAAFREHFHLGDGREKTRAWVKKVMAYDELYKAD